MFGTEDAWWCNGKEIAHLDAPGVIDVRLTKALIREMRPALREDRRVVLRRAASDWIEVRYGTADLSFVVDLVGQAAGVHRAAAGQPAKRPPEGRDLDRRRRFH
jgi:hypothetical protein